MLVQILELAGYRTMHNRFVQNIVNAQDFNLKVKSQIAHAIYSPPHFGLIVVTVNNNCFLGSNRILRPSVCFLYFNDFIHSC